MKDESPLVQDGAWFIFTKMDSFDDYASTIYHGCKDERLPSEFEEEMWVRACVYPNLDEGVCWRCNELVPDSISAPWYLHNFDALQRLADRGSSRRSRELYLLDVGMRATYRALQIGNDTKEASEIMEHFWEVARETGNEGDV